MKLGELFFSLGFQSSGTSEIAGFENAISSASDAVDVMQQSFNELLLMIEKIAVKMGAVTTEEMEQFRSSKNLTKGTKELVVAEKEHTKQIEKQPGLIRTLHGKLSSFVGELNAVRIETMAAATAFTYFTKSASEMAVQIDKIAALTGLSTGSLQKIGDMAAQTGASLDDVAGAVRHFQEESVNISLGRGGNIGAWQMMGLSPHEDPMAILDKLSKKLKTMPTTLGTTMAKDLGLSDDLIYFLKNADNLAPPSEETILTDKEIKRLKDFNFYFNRVWEQSKRILSKLAAVLSPIASQLLYAGDRIGRMFGFIISKIEPFFDTIQRFVPLLTVAFAMLAAKLWPVTTAILGFLLVVEDIYTFFQGGDSVLGRWVNMFKEAATWVEAIKVGIAAVADALTGGLFTEGIGKAIFEPGKFISDLFGGDKSKPPEGAAVGSASAGGASVVNNVQMQIDGSKDPKATAEEVQKKIHAMTGDSFYQQPLGGH